ncbi:MAG: cation:proton antiporter [Candidatus Aceula meridiana]|nr:cation:proton antiporter [Candidatus Aceula meridiana]
MMLEIIQSLFEKISLFHINILFILGLAIFGGTLGGRLFQKMRIPQVVGYIVIGIVFGKSGLNIISYQMVEIFQPFNYFALGLIGFMIGGELKKTVLARYGKQFFKILFFEGLSAFAFVTIFVGIAGTFLLKDAPLAWALGLILGSIASATAPAATTDVLWEYRTKGPLTTTVLGIVALDDALALFLFAIAASLATRIIGASHETILLSILHPLYEIGGAIFVGGASGLILIKLLQKYGQKERMLTIFIGMVLFVLGLAQATNISILLAAMILGAVVVNGAPHLSKGIFQLAEGFTPPIYVLFFVFVGAKLNFSHLTPLILALILLYLFGRTFGKMLGSFLGAYISHAPKTVQKYIPFCLFSQAGVAIGLSIVASNLFPEELGNLIIVIVTSSTFVVQLIGPPCVKYAIVKSGEAGLNITEEDLIHKTKLTDLIDKKFPLIEKNTTLGRILEIFENNPYFYYPVVDDDKKLQGIISIDTIRQAFMFTDISSFLLAVDIMEPARKKILLSAPAEEVKQFFDLYHLDFVPVVDETDKVIGCIEARMFYQFISKKMLEAEQKVFSLE